MLQSLINKDNIIKRELLEVILKTNNDILYSRIDFILKYSLKVKDLETFISSAILLNKNNYFGTYSLNFNREILESVTKKDKDMFLKIFSNPMRNEIFNNEYLNKGKTSEIKYYYDIEKIVYFYLYQKKYYDCFYEITLDKIQELKTEIYKVKNIKTNHINKDKNISHCNWICIKIQTYISFSLIIYFLRIIEIYY